MYVQTIFVMPFVYYFYEKNIMNRWGTHKIYRDLAQNDTTFVPEFRDTEKTLAPEIQSG